MFKRTIITVLVTAFIVISNIQAIYGLETGIIKQCDYLNIRSGPSTSYKVVSKAYTNNVVEILGKSGSWYKIKTSGNIEGWVSSKYIGSYKETTEEVKGETLITANSSINKIIDIANTKIGKPYKWGSTGPNSFDCSGFTSYIYQNGAGINLPRTSGAQVTASNTTNISTSQRKPGDIGGNSAHVVMYIMDYNGGYLTIEAMGWQYGVVIHHRTTSYTWATVHGVD